jgi:hypothetical protein
MSLIMDVLHKAKPVRAKGGAFHDEKTAEEILDRASEVLSAETAGELPPALDTSTGVPPFLKERLQRSTRKIPAPKRKSPSLILPYLIIAAGVAGVVLVLALFPSFFSLKLKSKSGLPPIMTPHAVKKASPASGAPASAEKPELQGVVLDDKEPLCLINGNILKKGETWQGKKITSISAEGVTLTDPEGKTLFIKSPR